MWIRPLILVTALLVLAPPAAAHDWRTDTGDVRMFAVGNKQRLDDAVTYADLPRQDGRARWTASSRTARRFVQAGVDDVASHLRPADPARAAPGARRVPRGRRADRGADRRRAARAPAQQTSASGAILVAVRPYAAAGRATTRPSTRASPRVRALFLALTDTLYRSFYETFRDLAVEHGVYIAATIERRAGARVEASERPGAGRAPARSRTSRSAPTHTRPSSPYPGNTTYVFAPDGEVLVPDGQRRHAREPAQTGGVIRGSTVEGVPDAARAAAARRVPGPRPRVRRGPRPRGARYARRTARRR